jgi:competence protein ComGC
MEMHMQRQGKHIFGMSLIEVLVVVSILALLVGILLPAIGATRRTARSMQSNTPTRGIHQGMFVYSQSNNTWFPGLDGHGNGNPSVEDRFELLLKGRYFTGEYAISPVEQRTAWTTGTVTTAMYSYAMLELNPGASFDVNQPVPNSSPFARRKEWRGTANTAAVVISDRNTGADPIGQAQSINTTTPGDWRGSVAFNDNHVTFETTSVIPKTNYAKVANKSDALFTAASGDDALMIYSGTR